VALGRLPCIEQFERFSDGLGTIAVTVQHRGRHVERGDGDSAGDDAAMRVKRGQVARLLAEMRRALSDEGAGALAEIIALKGFGEDAQGVGIVGGLAVEDVADEALDRPGRVA
jgi:hypothetical protein